MNLRPFYFAHPGLFVVPVEAQRRSGVSPAYADALRETQEVTDGFVEQLNAAIAGYWDRLEAVSARAPRSWFPPRFQNICVVTDPDAGRPYYQPFVGSSWLVYASDFEPETSSATLATFLMVLNERLWIDRSLRTAVAHCLSWFLALTAEEIEDFCAGCRRCTRPDSEAYRALADAMPWVLQIRHAQLQPPDDPDSRVWQRIDAMELFVPAAHAGAFAELATEFERVGAEVTATYHRVQRAPTEGRDPVVMLCDWIREHRPRVVVVDRDHEPVWDPDQPEVVDRLRAAVAGVTERAAASICADVKVVSDSTARFMAAVRDPASLPSTGEEVEQADGAYLHESRGMMVYALEQPGLDVLHEEAPPYHRLLLEARTTHEWGHIADDAGLVRLDPTRAREHDAALERAGAIYDAIIGHATPSQIEGLAGEFADRRGDTTLGRALAQAQLARMGDYKANLIARALLPVAAMEAYVRVNVRSLARQPSSLVHRLARHAYEYQYLGLSQMTSPAEYFFGSTWFERSYVDRGICTLPQAVELFALMGQVCACYAIDDTRFGAAATS